MKKYLQSIWSRTLAVVLCSVSIVIGIGAGSALVGVYGAETKDEMYASGCDEIAENYAAYLYDNIEDLSKIEDFLKEKNFTCSVTQLVYEHPEDKDAPPQEIVLFNNLEEESKWDYVEEIEAGTVVNYKIDTAFNAIRNLTTLNDDYYMIETPITEYFFDIENGLFYYYAGDINKYFLADYVKVSSNGLYYDYELKKIENEIVYYNSYYDIELDTSLYENWEWVSLNEVKLMVAQDEYKVGNKLKMVMDNSSIQPYIYEGMEYYVADNMISCYSLENRDFYRILIHVNDLSDVERAHGKIEGAHEDMFAEWKIFCDIFFENVHNYMVVLGLCIIVVIVCLIWMACSAKSEKECLGFWNKIPVGVFSIAIMLLETPFIVLFLDVIEDRFSGHMILPMDIWLPLCAATIFAMVLLAMVWLLNIITRCKTKTLIRYSEIYYAYQIIKWSWVKGTTLLKSFIKVINENIKLLFKGLIIVLAITFVEFLVILCFRRDIEIFMWLFILEKILEIFVIGIILVQMQKLQDGSKRIAAGNLSDPIDTSKMLWEFKRHGENINKVSEGISFAVEERMKSEHFRTELITNVSHDIKTPLTSIINYVDLIKKQEISDETLKEYIDVLDRQSSRLKKLIEDLMEASKASTGNLAVNMEKCDVEVLLSQVVGEFTEKLEENQLELVVQKPENPIFVLADGRHMWRVFDNLLNNVYKYSLPGTRVYISLVKSGSDVMITFKNISKTALNISSEELMERFVRGDSSRNTEGSGLGLSIAESLTILMNGSMKLEIDGDLFKVILRFKAIEK